MNELRLLQESVVDESEIDSLGHLNVRFYLARAAKGHYSLINELGFKAGEGQSWRRTDTYNRFLKEQFAGARLGVMGGLVSIEGQDGVSGYYEIRNLETNDVAAAFVMTSHIIDMQSETVVVETRPSAEQLTQYQVEVPDYGRPRTLSLLPPKEVSFDEISALIPEEPRPLSFNGRREGLVLPDDCDENGRLREDVDPMSVIFRPQPGEELKNMGPPIQRDEHGRRYSFAMMEIRSTSLRKPRSGDTVLSMSADVAFGEKWRHSRRWMFAKESGILLGMSDQASVCMDLDARKAIPIPAVVRQEIEQTCLPDFK